MKTVRVIYHHEDESWWAESPDVDRWYAAGDSYAAVAKLAEEGIPFALSAKMSFWSISFRLIGEADSDTCS